MEIAKGWRLTQGVRQDDRGRLYRTLVNSRGKQDIVFVQGVAGLEPARTIPAPVEQLLKRVVLKLKPQERKQRLAVVEYRLVCEREVRRFVSPLGVQAFVDFDLRPLMRSPDQGKTWVAVERAKADYFNQWHQEAK